MFNFKFLSKMTKKRLNLRKVATIVACLAVTTMFASCGGNKDDDDGNGKDRVLTAEEKKVKGAWGSVSGIPTGYVFAYSTPDGYVEKWQKGGYVFSFYVYDDNGKGHFAYSSSSGYGWSTFNWRIEGNKIYHTKNVGTNWVNGVQVAKDKKFDDSFVYFKVTVNYHGNPVLRTMQAERANNLKPGETIDSVLSDHFAWANYSEYDKLE